MAKNGDIPEKIDYWHWVNDNVLGVVGATNVYHFDLSRPEPGPLMVFARYSFFNSLALIN